MQVQVAEPRMQAAAWPCLVRSTVPGESLADAGSAMVRTAETPGTRTSRIPTRLPKLDFGAYASLVTRMRSQEVGPVTGRSRCRASVCCTAARRAPRSVSTATSATGGPMADVSNATSNSCRSTGPVKRTSSHSPTAPFHPSERHPVRRSPSSAAYGRRPGSRADGLASMEPSDEEAITSLTSRYRAVDMAPVHFGSSRSVVFGRSSSVSVADVLRRTSPKIRSRLRRVSVSTVSALEIFSAPGSSPRRIGRSSVSSPCSARASTASGAPSTWSASSRGTVPATGAAPGTR